MDEDDWFRLVIPPHIDLVRPGIYEWHIEGVGSYIGRATRLRERFRAYPRNLRRMASGLPYRAGKPEAYRGVHRALAAARAAGCAVTFSVIENCAPEDLAARERYWIRLRGSLNG